MTPAPGQRRSRLGTGLALLGLVVVALLVWFLGPLLAIDDLRPMDSVAGRVVVLAGLLAVIALARWIRRQGWRIDLGDVAVVLAGLVVPTAIGWIGWTEVAALRTQDRLGDLAVRLQAEAGRLMPGDPVDRVLPLLRIVDEAETQAGGDPKTSEAIAIARRQLLTEALLPRVVRQVEASLRRPDLNTQYRYLLLKAYLALGDRQRIDTVLIAVTLQTALERDAPAATDPQRGDASYLIRQLELMLSIESGEPVALDRALIDELRRMLSQVPLANLAMWRAQQLGQSFPGPAWTVAAAGGPQAHEVFRRASGQPITDTSVPVLYTPAGFERLHNDIGRIVADVMADDLIVLGPRAGRDNLTVNDLVRDSLQLYQNDYIRTWDNALHDLRFNGSVSGAEVERLLRQLSAPDSPLLALARSAAEATTTQPPGPIDDHFAVLKRWVTAPAGGVAPISHTLAALRTLHAELEAADAARSRGESTDAQAARARQVMATATKEQIPPPFRGLVLDLMRNAVDRIAGGP